MFNAINKYKVSILWSFSILLFIICATIARFKPFSHKASGIIMWFIFNSALLATIFSAVRKGNKRKAVFCVLGMVYITYSVVIRFV